MAVAVDVMMCPVFTRPLAFVAHAIPATTGGRWAGARAPLLEVAKLVLQARQGLNAFGDGVPKFENYVGNQQIHD